MLKYSSIALLAVVLAVGAGPVPLVATQVAAQGVELPGGDALDFTPPQDITQKQVRAAPRRDRRKFRRVANGTYTPMRKRSRKISVTARGQ